MDVEAEPPESAGLLQGDAEPEEDNAEVNVFVVEREEDDEDADGQEDAEPPRAKFSVPAEDPEADETESRTDAGPTLLVLGDTQTAVEVYGDNEDLELMWSNELLVSPVPRESGRRQQGLTSEEAAKRLIVAAEVEVLAFDRPVTYKSLLAKFLWSPFGTPSILSGLALVAFFVYGLLLSNPYQYRITGALIEGIWILASVACNFALYLREERLTSVELHDRTVALIEKLKDSGMNMIQEVRIPSASSISVARVVRDGVVRTFPFNLLVEGDIIELAYGDRAPCAARYVFSSPRASSDKMEFVLRKAQLFTPGLFGIPPARGMDHELSLNNGRFQFMLTETPLTHCLKEALGGSRPWTLVGNQVRVLDRIWRYRVLWIVAGCSLLVNTLRFAIPYSVQKLPWQQWFEMIVVCTVNTMLPLLMLMVPVLMLSLRAYGNAQVLSLFDQLQATKKDYEDEEDVDEFDAAPPPTMDVDLDWRLVLRRFRRLFMANDPAALTRSSALYESLASITAICSVDKEGTIAMPFPELEQVYCFDETGDAVVMDITEDPRAYNGLRFEESDWPRFISSLKPLGLNQILNTNCGFAQGRLRGDPHKKLLNIQLHGRMQPARETCQCRLAREMGFVPEALDRLKHINEIYTFAPYHDSIRYTSQYEYAFEVPSMYCSVVQEEGSPLYQLFCDGTLNLVLDMCADYWTGSTLEVIDGTIEDKIYDYFQTCIENDMQVVAFSYRPIRPGTHMPTLEMKDPDELPIYIEMPYVRSKEQADANGPNPFGDPAPFDPTIRLDRTVATEQGVAQQAPVDSDYRKRLSSEEGKKFFEEVVKGQTFLGMAVLSTHHPKPNVGDFIEDVRLAGIRFVYFSPAPERETKAFGDRLGLETDWNSCILLSDDGEGNGYRELHDIKARLPRGINQIRTHLHEVDDIPLHVSLFAECSPSTTVDMLRIFQDFGEVVCVIGSVLDAASTAAYACADLAIAMEPVHTQSKTKRAGGTMPPLALGAAFTSLPCGLVLQADTSLYIVTQLIREARTIATNATQAFTFLLGSVMSLSALLFLSQCLLLPPILQGYQILWMCTILFPLMAVSLVFSPREQDMMTRMPAKNIHHLRDRWRFFSYWIYRFLPTIPVCIAVFVLILVYAEDGAYDFDVFGLSSGAKAWIQYSADEQRLLLVAQNYTLTTFVIYMLLISATTMDRTRSVWEAPPYRNRVWLASFFIW
ncbi:hypothetical protein DFJ74DRAFT_681622 [Hyaloraphidium curvatum]|nr:hypothetical protein DFJ74DRAFT_681622 [Hyaloraphidium curvatum]